MPTKSQSAPRCAVLVGSYTSGKTTLLEAMLHAAGAIARRGKVSDKSSVGDASPEAREFEMTVEPNVAVCDYLGERWSLIDCPGSVELAHDTHHALKAADVAVVVADPEPGKALMLAPILRFLDAHKIPHLLFVNKMDKTEVRVRELLSALQAVSSRPLVLRQVPIRDGDRVVGAIDLVSERAWKYREGQPSDLVELPDTDKDRGDEARQEMMEALADFDDALLEQLLEDKIPGTDELYRQFSKDLAEDLIVPVLLGSAEHANGVTRLWKALRHDAPEPSQTAARLGIPADGGFVASVIKTFHQAHTGKLSLARIWSGSIKEGETIGDTRPAGLYKLIGGDVQKTPHADAGELLGIGRLDEVKTGDLVTSAGVADSKSISWPQAPEPVYGLALQPKNRQDEVKLTQSLAKLIEEDPSISLQHNSDTGEMLLLGQGEIQLKLALARLKNKFNVAVDTSRPMTAYKETIRRGTKHHARFKRQTGGHGQFGDVHVEIKPLPRGSGFNFVDKIVGGAIPRQYISSVESGVKEYLPRGPLGFPVVDIEVTLYDGQYHSVDSSDMAFKTAGRLAMSEAMPECHAVLLEPIFEVVISVPNDATSKVHGLVSGRRGQILGFEPRQGWPGWDDLKCYMPQSELHDLIIELRSLTLGVGTYRAKFDHLQELTGKLADKVVEARQAAQ